MERTTTPQEPFKPIKAYFFTTEIDDARTLMYFPVEIIQIENHISAKVRYPEGDEVSVAMSRLFPRNRESTKLFKKLMSRQERIINTTKKFSKQLQDLWHDKRPFLDELAENLNKNSPTEN
jgi:hypothetical protein